MSRGRDTSAIMRRVHGRDTAPELLLRRALWSTGMRYRVAPSTLPGKPDIVIPSARLAIFVDGDYWHGGQWVRRRLTALEDQFKQTRDRGYWLSKIRRNMRRDATVTATLLREGWKVLRFWESDVLTHLEDCVEIARGVVTHTPEGVTATSASLLPEKTVAEFFAGIGLMRMGLERQGWAVSFANDIDEQKYEMYSGHFADAAQHFRLGDIHNVSPDNVPSVSLATASFPCNDLSLAGSRDGLTGKQSSAFWGFIKLLEGMGPRKPPLVLLENVTGFLSSHRGEDFKQAMLALNALGYAVDALILDAANFVPQSRQRLFVVAVLQEASPHRSVGEQTNTATRDTLESAVRPRALVEYIARHPEIQWNIRPLPAPPTQAPRLDAILETLPDASPEWWSADRTDYLLNQMSPRHREMVEDMMREQQWSYGTVFRRMRAGKSMAELRTDGIAGCLRTPRGGSGRQILLQAGFGSCHARLITPREAACLMGADDYQIDVSLNQALFGFGDAVCVPAIEWLARYYLDPVVNELIHGQALQPPLVRA